MGDNSCFGIEMAPAALPEDAMVVDVVALIKYVDGEGESRYTYSYTGGWPMAEMTGATRGLAEMFEYMTREMFMPNGYRDDDEGD